MYPNSGQNLGFAQVADMLKITPVQLDKLLKGDNFPAADGVTNGHPSWSIALVKQWLHKQPVSGSTSTTVITK